jgi:hypothetical protein
MELLFFVEPNCSLSASSKTDCAVGGKVHIKEQIMLSCVDHSYYCRLWDSREVYICVDTWVSARDCWLSQRQHANRLPTPSGHVEHLSVDDWKGSVAGE